MEKSQSFNIKFIDLNNLTEGITRQLGSINIQDFGNKNTEEIVEDITKITIEACKRNKITKKSNNRKMALWWNEELTIIRKTTNKSRRKYQTCNNEEERSNLKQEFHKQRAIYKKKILYHKRKSWIDICERVRKPEPFGIHFKEATNSTRKTFLLSKIIKDDNTETSNYEESIEYLLQQHFKEDLTESDSEIHKTIRENSNMQHNLTDDEKFTIKEVEDIILNLGNNKSPGPDGITPEIMKIIFESNKNLIINLFNKCLEEGKFPTCWKEANLTLFNKSGKDGKKAEDYRPICLLSYWGKILDKLMTNRIMFHLQSNKKLNAAQYGFQADNSSTEAIINIIEKIRENKEKGNHTLIISLDVQSAFNSVWWPFLIDQLRILECPNNLINLVKDFLKDRTIVVNLNSKTIKRKYSKGCPQGSNSGPLFWLVVANTLLNMDLEDGATIQAFADDFILIITASGRHTIEEIAQRILKKLEDWCTITKMKFSINKTKMLMIPKKGTAPEKIRKRLPSIKFNNSPIKAVTEIKYLGVWIDDGLNWIPHANYLKEKCTTTLNKLHRMSGRKWGLNKKVLKEIYIRGIERSITYACAAWWPLGGTAKLKNVLNQIQRLALIGITNCFRTVATSTLQILAGVMPIDLVLDKEITIHAIKKSKNNNINYYGLELKKEDIETKLKKWHKHPQKIHTTKWKTDLPDNKEIEIFTDGSKIKNKTGAAFCIYNEGHLIHNQGFRLSNHNTVYQAEYAALNQALNWSLINCNSGNIIKFFIDCQSVLKSINKFNNQDPNIEEIKEKIDSLSNNNTIKFNWIKSHVGITGNEMADKIAKEATENKEVDIKLKATITSIKSMLKKKSIQIWQTRWNTGEDGIHTKKFIKTVSLKRTMTNFYTNQLLTDHGQYPKYFNRFNIKKSRCKCGQAPEESGAIHYLINCNIMKPIRISLNINFNNEKECNKEIWKHLESFSELMKVIYDNEERLCELYV